jgi:hypothetical protein
LDDNNMIAQPTAIQRFAMKVMYQALGIDPINRTMEEYEQIQSLIPTNLKVVHGIINDYLKDNAVTNFSCPQFCRFRAGDEFIRIEDYPRRISREVVREALIAHGWRKAKWTVKSLIS